MMSDFENSDEEDVSNDLIEPQVILQNDNEMEYQGGHFLFEESTSTCHKCVVCQAKQPSREHVANHFINELIEELEDLARCDKCDFSAAEAKNLVLHDVMEHEGTKLDRILQDASLVSSKRAELEARGHRQSLGTCLCLNKTRLKLTRLSITRI